MVLFDKIKKASGKTIMQETAISNPIATIAAKTVLGDILSEPENFKIEIYMNGKEVVAKVVYTKTMSGRWHAKPDDFTLKLYPKLPK